MAKVDITAGKYVDYLKKVTAKIASEKDYITELDAATGDGDHWANMNTGFTKLMEIEDQLRAASLAELFKKAAMTIMSGVGGSSGILYASAYLKASAAVGSAETMDAAKLLEVLEAELQGIMQRGNGQPGFKTMIDPLYEAVEAMKAALPEGGSGSDPGDAGRCEARHGSDAGHGSHPRQGVLSGEQGSRTS